MGKETKTSTNKTATAPVDAGVTKGVTAPGTPALGPNDIDITKLTPAQLSALQKQLKAKKAVVGGKKDERFAVIDTMLKAKDGENFKYTTREILNALVEKNLVDTTAEKYDQVEIKKIQARKQFLEKKTDKKGQLVHPKGTFGYKPSDAVGFVLTGSRVAKFFTDGNASSLTSTEVKTIKDALAALK